MAIMVASDPLARCSGVSGGTVGAEQGTLVIMIGGVERVSTFRHPRRDPGEWLRAHGVPVRRRAPYSCSAGSRCRSTPIDPRTVLGLGRLLFLEFQPGRRQFGLDLSPDHAGLFGLNRVLGTQAPDDLTPAHDLPEVVGYHLAKLINPVPRLPQIRHERHTSWTPNLDPLAGERSRICAYPRRPKGFSTVKPRSGVPKGNRPDPQLLDSTGTTSSIFSTS